MSRLRYRSLSVKKLIFGLLCLTLLGLALPIIYSYWNVLIVAKFAVNTWASNNSHLPGCCPLCKLSAQNHTDQRSDTSQQRKDLNSTFSMNSTCSIQSEKYNWTSCPSCFRPGVAGFERTLKEVVPSDSFIGNQPAEYFKIRPEIVQSLITDYLIVPRINSTKYYLVAVQASILDRRQERDTVRNTWGSVAQTQTWPNRSINAHVKVIFVVARHLTADKKNSSSRNDSRLFDEIKSEADLHNDILYLDMIDSYQNLTLKLLSAFKWINDNCPCVKFVLKVDYDTFVNVPLLVDTLLYFEDRFQFSIVGSIYTGTSFVHRTGKWAVPISHYPMRSYPEYASGCAYILSHRTLTRIVDSVTHFRIFSVEDAFITGVMRRVIGCRVFTFQKLFTNYLDNKWNYCWMLEDRKIVGMNSGGLQNTKIWDTFVRGACLPVEQISTARHTHNETTTKTKY